MTETGKVDGSGGGGGRAGATATGGAGVFDPSAAPLALLGAFAPAAPAAAGFAAEAFAPALTTPVWFAVGATWASVGSSCALLLPAFGSTPADVRPAPAHAAGAKAQQAASNRIRELIMVLW